MFRRNHPARSARILSFGLSTSALFGMVTAFSYNQMNADVAALKDQQLQEAASVEQANLTQDVAPATAPNQNTSSTSKNSATTSSNTVAPATPDQTAAQRQTVTAPAAPTTDTSATVQVTAPSSPNVAAPALPLPAPASNAKTSGSK